MCVAVSAQAAPVYDVHVTWANHNLPPGGEGRVSVQVRNVGDAVGSEDIVITNELPTGVLVKDIEFVGGGGFDGSALCAGESTKTATCTLPASELPQRAVPPGLKAGDYTGSASGYLPEMGIDVEISPSAVGLGVNTATVTGGSGASATDVDEFPFSSSIAGFGVAPGSFVAEFYDAAYPFGNVERQAGEHPFELRVSFDMKGRLAIGPSGGRPIIDSYGSIRSAVVTLPRGLSGNPEATPKCNPTEFAQTGATLSGTACPPESQVGYLTASTPALFAGALARIPLYNVDPPKGFPADFAFNAGGLVVGHIYPNVDPAQDYALKSLTPDISDLVTVVGTEATIWGVPADPAHDRHRYFSETTGGNATGAPWGSAPIRPFISLPMDCGFENGGARIQVSAYSNPQLTPVQEYGDPLNVTGCDDPRIRFEPDISLQPTSRAALLRDALRLLSGAR